MTKPHPIRPLTEAEAREALDSYRQVRVMIPGYSCGYPIDMTTYGLTGTWDPTYSAIPANVYATWLAGDGPHPVAWLGDRVGIAQMMRGSGGGNVERYGWYRRLPKGEREPDAVWRDAENLPRVLLVMQDFVREMTTLSTVPYRLEPWPRPVPMPADAWLRSEQRIRILRCVGLRGNWSEVEVRVIPGTQIPLLERGPQDTGLGDPERVTVGYSWLVSRPLT